MCGRIIQASGPLRFAIVDGLNVVDGRYANMPPRYNGAPSQDILVIRQNHETGERSLDPLKWGLIPYWCKTPNSDESRSTPRRRRRLSKGTREFTCSSGRNKSSIYRFIAVYWVNGGENAM